MMASPRVLVLGGSGLLGESIVKNFHKSGWQVTALARGERQRPGEVEFLRLDRRDPSALSGALRGRAFDLTIDLLAYSASDIEALAAISGFSPGRVIAASTGQVYLVTVGPCPPYREPDFDAPEMDEPAAGTRTHANWVYGVGKRRMEKALRQAFPGALALRIPIVLGEGDATGRLWAYVERILDGGPILVPGALDQPLRFVWSEDVARLLLALATRQDTPPALNWAQPDLLTVRGFIEALAAALERPCPPLLLCSEDDLAGAGLDGDVSPYSSRWCSILDPSQAQKLTGLTATPFSEALPRILREMQARAPASDVGYAHRASELTLARRLQENA